MGSPNKFSKGFILLNLLVVGFSWIAIMLDKESLVSFSILFLGPFQFIPAIIDALRGNSIMQYYSIISIAFLVIYVFGLNDIAFLLGFDSGRRRMDHLIIIPPLSMATAYTVLILLVSNKCLKEIT